MDLDEIREEFARTICAKVGLAPESEICRAFASTPREDFLPSPPWRVGLGGAGFETSDPAELYRDGVMALRRERSINTGQPSLHAACLHVLRVRHGEAVVHVGAGAGYYTALLAKLVGEGGWVDAYEVERDLAVDAERNLRGLPWVRVHAISGAEGVLRRCDVLYVSAGASRPVDAWLDALRPGGRLLFPLTARDGTGAMLLVTRRKAETGVMAARFVMEVAFIPCVGARDAESEMQLTEAFRGGRLGEVRTLYRDNEPDESVWSLGPGWWLSTRDGAAGQRGGVSGV